MVSFDCTPFAVGLSRSRTGRTRRNEGPVEGRKSPALDGAIATLASASGHLHRRSPTRVRSSAMPVTATPLSTPAVGAMVSQKQQFLAAYEREHAITMRVLRAFPPEKSELQPHPRCKTARELAFIFALERGLATLVFNDAFAAGGDGASPRQTPAPPASWNAVLAAVAKTHEDFGNIVRATPEEKLFETVKFFTAPKTLGDVSRIDFLWFILSDEIHHRGQLSIYLRMADAKVPSIYGPTADEPWM